MNQKILNEESKKLCELPKEKEIRGRITQLFFSSDNFSAGYIKKPDEKYINFSGKFCVPLNENVILKGRWICNKQYGNQFEADFYEQDIKLDTYGLQNFLANNKEFKGIGKVKAKLIALTFQDNFEEILVNNPEKIAKVAKIKVEIIKNIQKVWKKGKKLNKVKVWLAKFEISQFQINTLTLQFGIDIKIMLEKNPYTLIELIDGFGFKKIDKIARKMGIKKEDKNRIQAGIIYIIREELKQGHCWTKKNEVIRLVNELLILDSLDSINLIKDELTFLIDISGKLKDFLINNNQKKQKDIQLDNNQENNQIDVIGLTSIYNTEKWLFDFFEKTKSQMNPHITDFEFYQNELNDLQYQAVLNFVENQISFISGSAGTGKTYIISKILEMCKKAKLSVALCAPTGKAAKRIEEMIGNDIEAFTIHRLLEAQGGDIFLRDWMNPLKYDVIIIDEVSMLDINLVKRFLSATLKNTIILFIGDHNQLPPVGAGNLLRDILQTKNIPTTILTKSMRQAGILKENCNLILQKKIAPTVIIPVVNRGIKPKISPWIIFNKTDPEKILQYIKYFFSTRLTELNFDILNDVQLLTPTHKGTLGTKNLNKQLQKIIQKKLYNNSIEMMSEEKNPKFYIGDKIIQTKNNYKLGIMNGDTGIIKSITSQEISVIFGNLNNQFKVIIPKNKQLDLQLAYALTIHKSQGSEYKFIILIIHKSHSYQHHNGLFYTGITRAKNHVLVIGDNWGIKNCVQKEKTNKRRTFLSLLFYKDLYNL